MKTVGSIHESLCEMFACRYRFKLEITFTVFSCLTVSRFMQKLLDGLLQNVLGG